MRRLRWVVAFAAAHPAHVAGTRASPPEEVFVTAAPTPAPSADGRQPRKVVVLASGAGTLLQAVLDDPEPKPYQLVAVGSDRVSCHALERARDHQVPTFTCGLRAYADRDAWDRALTTECRRYGADLVVLAGFMKLVGPRFLRAFENRVVNAHPSLLPAFPGMRASADALAYGVKLTGCTVFLVDGGIDAGPIIAQEAVPVHDDDDAGSLHERIKVTERRLLVEVVRLLAGSELRVDGRKVVVG